MSEAEVRQAFADQADTCARLGSAFTGRLCEILGKVLDDSTEVGRRVLGWAGPPDALHDNIPLRLAGGLHWLVRSGRVPALGALYPPAPPPQEAALADAVVQALEVQDTALQRWLDRAPQTNEVGRSAVLMSGLLAVAARFQIPMHLYELGASAGLNLQLDRYGYQLGDQRFGVADSPLQLRPTWSGGSPPQARVSVAERGGVDLDPLDARHDAEILLAYVWPDQPDRLARLEAALEIAKRDPPQVENADAADWLERTLSLEPPPGVTRVVLHSIAFQYFAPGTQQRLEQRIEAAGTACTEDTPLAWLRFEMLPGEHKPSLRLRTWPGEDCLLAWAHPHGSSVEWVAA